MRGEAIGKISNFILSELEWWAEGAVVAFSPGSIGQKMARMDRTYAQWEINKALRYAKNRGFLIERNKRYILSEKGRKWIDHQKFNKLTFTHTGKWDGIWRLIIFDIPEKERGVRTMLRNKLFDWQCTKLQHSVYITPYNCGKEINELAVALSAESYVHVVEVKKLNPNLEIKLHKIYKDL